MSSIQDICNQKGADIWSIGPEQSVLDAIRLMDEKGIGALAVIHEDELVGILSERDYARKVVLKGRSSNETKIKEIMTREVIFTQPDQGIKECMAVMTKHRIRHLPVMENGKLISMISLGDVVKEIISDQEYQIEHLQHYVAWEESY
ncbi:MAG: CBS domain-containing protein [Gammaproteobacteria bacterium]|nr:CBS domain-containing protein [Gammaproteobacteria bacterium]